MLVTRWRRSFSTASAKRRLFSIASDSGNELASNSDATLQTEFHDARLRTSAGHSLNKIGKVKLFAYPSEDFQLFGWLQLLDLILDFFRVHPRFASSFLA